MKLIAIITILFLVSTVSAFEVSSSNPSPGDTVDITGTTDPGQEVNFQSSFQMDLPVNSGKYEYTANGVEIPQKPNRFSVTASGVKDLNVGVKIGIWISKQFNAVNGEASISQSDIPPGRYDLKVFGDASEGAPSVNLKVTAETAVKADSAGKYTLSIDTTGVASGAYKISGGGDTKIIQVGGAENVPEAEEKSVSAQQKAPTTEISEGGSNGNNKLSPEQKPAENTIKPEQNGNAVATQNITAAQNASGEKPPAEKGFIDWLKDSIGGILG